MAVGGAKGGFSHGSTDQDGDEAVEGKIHFNDWHATILHLLGLNHKQLTYRYAGRDFCLTNVAASRYITRTANPAKAIQSPTRSDMKAKAASSLKRTVAVSQLPQCE